ncbi:unnamed protein product [Ceutorhynchus assimilis]|uniref:UDP-glucuronosyltransferase n=1 Tax=Ceutorhynchus assimilis TaxID=467358 RepID=A0A9N9MUI3_9CUCU|nr:unnamed protein product [Ceutorhynchus assimilis]
MVVVLQILFICSLSSWQYSNGAKILGIFSLPARSHYSLAEKLMKGFARVGHDITMVAPYPTENLPKNVTWEDIIVEGVVEKHKANMVGLMLKDSHRSAMEKLIIYQHTVLNHVNQTLFSFKVKALLSPTNKFDIVIIAMLYNEAHKYYAHYFECPLIVLGSMGATPFLNNIVSNPSPPSYVQYYLGAEDFSFDNFWHRFSNFFDYIFDFLVDYFYIRPVQNKLLQRAFPGAPPVDEIPTSLVFINSHESFMEPVPLVPNMIPIGGYHVEQPKQLPKDLKQFLDGATNGAIYFSMGSNLNVNQMEKKQIFFNVFGKLKEIRVLCKYADENFSNMSRNVLVKSWMPQNDILAHPNIKLFITHGGQLSTIESVYHAVPILAIPVFGDQFRNAKRAAKLGFGLEIGYNNERFNEETLLNYIEELLANPKYKENAKERSAIFHDRPLKPMENAVFWLEHVLRHKGADHLKVSGIDLPLYKYLMLDVVGSLILLILVFLYSVRLVFEMVMRLFTCSRKKEKEN